MLCQPASEFLPMIGEVHDALVAKMASIPGAKVENNKFCLSVHFRCVEEKVAQIINPQSHCYDMFPSCWESSSYRMFYEWAHRI